MNTLFKLFDTLTESLSNIAALAVVFGNADFETISPKTIEGYMATLIDSDS